jgi:hypothetical protein
MIMESGSEIWIALSPEGNFIPFKKSLKLKNPCLAAQAASVRPILEQAIETGTTPVLRNQGFVAPAATRTTWRSFVTEL